jgi:hypothetical protein
MPAGTGVFDHLGDDRKTVLLEEGVIFGWSRLPW